MTDALIKFGEILWRLGKIAFEVLVLDFVASFLDGYRNTRWRYQQHFAAREWAR